MVGFPGETDELFEESYNFIAAQPFTYLHLFPFSARPATPGWELHRDHPVPTSAVAERMGVLRDLIERKNFEFRSRFIGKKMSAVTLITAKEMSDRQCVNGMADNFVPIEIAGNIEPNRMLLVQVTGLTAHGLSGKIAGSIASAVMRMQSIEPRH
jgi:threonylcarbamoyladenosine tRNA methylthiotransferase MtaB